MITPQILLEAYRQGIFPMAESANNNEIKWYQPVIRGQLSIEALHIPRRLLKSLKNTSFTITINKNFRAVIEACATETADRPNTWINNTIIDMFCALNEQGHAHSIEIWDKNTLIGGLYGVQIGQVFCGESMFSRKTNASKIALAHLVARLHHTGFKVLDTQYINEHLLQFGAYEIPHEEYNQLLEKYAHTPSAKPFGTRDISQMDILKNYLDFRNL